VSGLRGREAVALVGRREVTQRLREKSFLVSMGVTVVIIVLVAVIPPLLGAGGPSKFTIAVTDASSAPIGAAARQSARGRRRAEGAAAAAERGAQGARLGRR
jgi:ABC-2 type transport system permease protein